MKRQALLACGAVALSFISASSAFAQTQLLEAPYGGADTANADMIALWHFDSDAPGKDASGYGHDLVLRGKDTHFVTDGKFGGALLVEDKDDIGGLKSQGVTTKDAEDINPKGAFTIEMWISPSEQLATKQIAFLIDKKYSYSADPKPENNTGYQLLLCKSGSQFMLEAQLGFGKDSAIIDSAPQTFEAGQWYHVAFAYDGKGEANLYLGATRIGHVQLKEKGAVTPSVYPLSIGDRLSAFGQRFQGRIDEVRILNGALSFVSGKVLLNATTPRTAYYRMAKNVTARVKVLNDTLQPLRGASIYIRAGDYSNKPVLLPELQPHESTFITVPLDTSMRPDSYQMTVNVQSAAKKNLGDAITFPFTIVSRALPKTMPIIMWDTATDNYKELKDVGFTDELVNMFDYSHLPHGQIPEEAMIGDMAIAARKQLDDMMAAQVGAVAVLAPGGALSSRHPEFNRTDRSGETVKNIDGLYPEVQKRVFATGAAVAKTFGDMPGWNGALLHTEVRGGSVPSFNEIDKKAYRDFSGQDIPPQVSKARGLTYRDLPNFPSNRIVPDDNPILKYYRWFWKTGDGWNNLNTVLNDGLKSTGRNDVFTWYDPAVRAASIYGSGGNVDYLNQWTYTYPNPIGVGAATDELFAMTGGHPGQKVMNMIQIIWWRAQTTRTPVKGQETEWEKVSPDAKFISIAPDHLSEAMWLELARPVQAIANHGWGSMGDHLGFKPASYTTTNLETRKRLTSMLQNVVKPLAPALMQVPDHPADVAFLESFASQMFAERGTYGGTGGWGGDSYIIARYAGLQPQIVYDETIEQKGLSQYKVLFLTYCDVLPQGVADAIKKFQQRGGIVIGDEFLAPGIKPDILLTSSIRGAPDIDKALLLKKAAKLRSELDVYYQHPVESSNPEVITRLRQFGNSQYVFVANDHRTYGDYVGQYKMVMEKGLPAKTQITLDTKLSGFVYDLTNHKQIPTTKIQGKAQFGVDLDGGGGNVFLVTSKPIGKLQITSSNSVKRGASIPVKVLLRDTTGKMVNAVIPLKVTILDSKNRVAEKSGYYGAVNGTLNLNLDIAPNDAVGKWQVEVTEALTGQKVIQSFVVR